MAPLARAKSPKHNSVLRRILAAAGTRKLRATCDLADRPDAGRGGLQPLVDLEVSPVSEFNAGQFQAESFGVRIAGCGDQR